VRFQFVAAEKGRFPVALLWRCLAVSRPGFYACQRRPPSARAHADRRLAVDDSCSTSALSGSAKAQEPTSAPRHSHL
jgi:hypothetical protein